MKRTLLIAAILALYVGISYSEQPGPGFVTKSASRLSATYVSQAVYQSSQTCVTSSTQSVFISSPSAASLFSINVSSVGVGSPFVAVYDGMTTTDTARLVSLIDARTNRQYFYNVAFSSQLAVYNYAVGGTPACIDIIYRLR